MNKPLWRLKDLIDLEFFLGQDDGEDLDILANRDREINSRLAATSTDTQSPPSSLLHGWLTERRKTTIQEEPDQENPLPGQVWQELFILFFWGALILGLISGGTLAFSFLSYSGAKPVNVSAYFGIFVLLQLLLFLLLGVLTLYRQVVGNGLETSFFYRILRRFFTKIMTSVSRRAKSKVSADTKLQWSGQISGINQLQQRYGSLFTRPFFLLAQLFGVSFNTGVFAATLMKVIGSDVAFGWQTTLQINAETVHGLVRWISIPWFWMLPDYCCPTLAQIEGSKLILKDGIYFLTTPALISWWPFLCLSVLFYGLLPRLVLLGVGSLRQRRELSALRFDHGRCRQIVHRMRTPLVSTHAEDEIPQVEENPPVKEIVAAPTKQALPKVKISQKPKPRVEEKNDEKPGTAPPVTPAPLSIPSIVAMVPDELFADCPRPNLQKQISGRLGYELTTILSFWTLDQSEDEEIAALKARMIMENCEDVLVLQEAWQPPIVELLSFLTLLRDTLGEQASIFVVLIGKPDGATMLTPVQKQNLQTWQQKIATLGDSGLQLIELIK